MHIFGPCSGSVGSGYAWYAWHDAWHFKPLAPLMKKMSASPCRSKRQMARWTGQAIQTLARWPTGGVEAKQGTDQREGFDSTSSVLTTSIRYLGARELLRSAAASACQLYNDACPKRTACPQQTAVPKGGSRGKLRLWERNSVQLCVRHVIRQPDGLLPMIPHAAVSDSMVTFSCLYTNRQYRISTGNAQLVLAAQSVRREASPPRPTLHALRQGGLSSVASSSASAQRAGKPVRQCFRAPCPAPSTLRALHTLLTLRISFHPCSVQNVACASLFAHRTSLNGKREEEGDLAHAPFSRKRQGKEWRLGALGGWLRPYDEHSWHRSRLRGFAGAMHY